jgi:hypothetical protein
LSHSALAGTFSLNYGGRLTQQNGAPVVGPANMVVKFWTAATGGTQLGAELDFPGVTLSQGYKHLMSLSID